jgi:hypothetical protein
MNSHGSSGALGHRDGLLETMHSVTVPGPADSSLLESQPVTVRFQVHSGPGHAGDWRGSASSGPARQIQVHSSQPEPAWVTVSFQVHPGCVYGDGYDALSARLIQVHTMMLADSVPYGPGCRRPITNVFYFQNSSCPGENRRPFARDLCKLGGISLWSFQARRVPSDARLEGFPSAKVLSRFNHTVGSKFLRWPLKEIEGNGLSCIIGLSPVDWFLFYRPCLVLFSESEYWLNAGCLFHFKKDHAD